MRITRRHTHGIEHRNELITDMTFVNIVPTVGKTLQVTRMKIEAEKKEAQSRCWQSLAYFGRRFSDYSRYMFIFLVVARKSSSNQQKATLIWAT